MVINPYIFKREPNTFIGGIAKLGDTGANAPILTAAELATTLGISESIIKGFKVVGEDVECRITSDYNTKIHSFGGTSKSSANQNITSFISNKLIDVGQGTFFNCDNLVEVSLSEAIVIGNTSFSKCNKLSTVYLPRVTTSYYGAFDQCMESLQSISLPSLEIAEASVLFNFCTSLSYVDMKKCKKLGESVLNNNMLNNLANNPTINVNIYLRNVNDGEPDGDLLRAYTQRNATINFYDDNGNFVETYNPNPELYTQNDACSIGANETESIGAGWSYDGGILVTLESSTESNWCLKFEAQEISLGEGFATISISGLEIGETYEISLDGRAEDATGLLAGQGFIRTDVNNGWASLAYADIDSFNWQRKSFNAVATDTDAILEYYPAFTASGIEADWSGFLDNISIKKIS